MAGNKSLKAAVRAKEDEFYTQLTDIEKELRYYKKHFKGKIVLCNCDDPFESNFFKYFVLNFNAEPKQVVLPGGRYYDFVGESEAEGSIELPAYGTAVLKKR